MSEKDPHQLRLLKNIEREAKEQEERYRFENLDQIKELKSEGVVLHPISVKRKSFGYADYPELSFYIPFQQDTRQFKENSSIECFYESESIKGILLGVNGSEGLVRLYTSDFPDWIEDKGVGIRLIPDQHTIETMKAAVENLQEHTAVYSLFCSIHGETPFGEATLSGGEPTWLNQQLNESQKIAVKAMINNNGLSIIHGPPGTGKTTTLVEGIQQLVQQGNKMIVSASSNAAVDHIALCLIQLGVPILRVGNSMKVNEDVFAHTPEGKLLNSKEAKDIKKMKIQAEQLRKMSFQYKRSFGKAEREQRSQLFKEVKNIRKEIRSIQRYFDQKLLDSTQVVIGTPIGLVNFLPETAHFDCCILDEAGQTLEPLAWAIFPKSDRWVIAGDPYQLPPTVLSEEAKKNGFSESILERAFKQCLSIFLLNTQYRMRPEIAEFSNRQFYEGQLKSNKEHRESTILFYDTAGTGFEEQSGEAGGSLQNEGELSIIPKIIEENQFQNVSLISPYSGQVQLAKNTLKAISRISTIDSFQGQESDTVIISLVRSNDDNNIGFLTDKRRMNVALTRAKEQLIVIGDSSTIANAPFYQEMMNYFEEINAYRSAWELMY